MRRRNAVVIGAVLALAFLLLPGRAAAEPRVFELSIRNGELSEDRRVVRVRQGDDVTLRWTTDKQLTIHLHGYDIEKSLAPGTPASMRFTARATGRFLIETHAHGRGGKRTLAHVEVHPR